TARDRFLHRASATVGVTTGGGGGGDVLPGHAPSLAEFAPGAASALLTWESAPGATSYRFCTGVPGTTPADCEDLADASAVVSWDTVLGAAGSAEERRVFSAGARVTSMAACTAGGCTPAGDGPLAGGLRWGA